MAPAADIHCIERAEETLRISLGQGGASPFLAHHRVDDPGIVKEAVRLTVNGNDQKLENLFLKYPRVGVWSAAMVLAERYGEDGHHRVYLPLGNSYGYISEISQDSRVRLRFLFRKAVLRLGLPLPNEGEDIRGYDRAGLRSQRVDDYFSQVGVALTQVEHLANIFQKYECESGVPDVQDSTLKLSQWEHDAVKRFCPPQLRRLPKVILQDWSGYHAGLYARFRAGEFSGTEFGSLFRDAVERLPPPKAEFGPRLVCHEAELFIRDGRTAVGFFADLGGERQQVRPRGDLRLVAPWPTSVPCWAQNQERSTAHNVKVLDGDTSFLVFDSASGRLLQSVGSAQNSLTVPCREIIVVSREPFTLDGDSSGALGIGAYICYATAEKPVTICSATRKIELVPQERPSINLLAGAVIGRSGGEQLRAGVSGVEVIIPASHELSGSRIELHISHPSIADSTVVLPCELSTGATHQIALTGTLPETGAFGMLKLELKQPGRERVLWREKAWHWPGLRSLTNGSIFDALAIPSNFDIKRSQFIKLNAANVLELMAADRAPYLEARIVFNAVGDDDGEGEPLAQFTLAPPGVSLIFREANGREKPLPHGQILALSPEDGSVIIVRTSQASAQLDVKGVLEAGSFDRFGRRILKSSGLAGSYSGPPGHLEVRYRDSMQTNWLKLLEIAAVATVRHFMVKQFPVAPTQREVVVTVELIMQPLRMRLRGRGLHSDEGFSLMEGDAGLTVARADGSNLITVELSTTVFPRADVYIVALDVDLGDGRWRALTNDRRDHYEWAVYLPWHNNLAISDLSVKAGLLLRATEVLQRCAALPCWKSIENHVLPIWRDAILVLWSEFLPDWDTLLQAAAAGWDAEASATWVPIHHPIEEFVNLFSAPLGYFSAFDGNDDGRGTEHLGYLQRFDSPRRFMADFMLEQQIELRVLASFNNFREVQLNRDLHLRGFEFHRFVEALKTAPIEERESLWTPRQDRLSLAHHSWCCDRFADRLRDVNVPSHNEHRLDALLEVCRSATDVSRDLNSSDAMYLPCPDRLVYAGKYEDLLRFGPLVLSLLAKHSRGATSEDLVQKFGLLCIEHEIGVVQTFGFLIRLAPELFGFYLLLWELATSGFSNNE